MLRRIHTLLDTAMTGKRRLIVDLGIALLALGSYKALSNYVHGEEHEVLTLGLAALLILLSGHIASILLLPVAIIEIILGMAAAGFGAKPGEGLVLLSNIGANLLLFMAGAEIDVKLLRRRALHAFLLGFLGFMSPGLLALGLSMVYGLSGAPVLIMLAGFSATSVALTYSILKNSGLTASRHGQLALTAAMVADIIGMIALSLATASIDPTIGLYVLILLSALLLGPLLPRVSGAPFELEVRLITMTIIILGVLSEILGMHSVLTSFILGVVASETVRSSKAFQEKLESLATGFFTPFFFIVSGMSVDPWLLVDNIMVVAGLGLVVAVLKMAPAYLYFTRISGARSRVAIILSSSQVPLLTVTIIAGNVGLNLGLIGKDLYIILMGTVVVTSLLASVVSSRFVRR